MHIEIRNAELVVRPALKSKSTGEVFPNPTATSSEYGQPLTRANLAGDLTDWSTQITAVAFGEVGEAMALLKPQDRIVVLEGHLNRRLRNGQEQIQLVIEKFAPAKQ